MIRNKRKFAEFLPAAFDGEFHWDFIEAAFKDTKISPMDFDAVLERCGHVLIFETKDAGVPIPMGQRITLEVMWRKKGCTVAHLVGKSKRDIEGIAWYHEADKDKSDTFGSRAITTCSTPDVTYQVYCWRRWAEGLPAPTMEKFKVEIWQHDYTGDLPGA